MEDRQQHPPQDAQPEQQHAQQAPQQSQQPQQQQPQQQQQQPQTPPQIAEGEAGGEQGDIAVTAPTPDPMREGVQKILEGELVLMRSSLTKLGKNLQLALTTLDNIEVMILDRQRRRSLRLQDQQQVFSHQQQRGGVSPPSSTTQRRGSSPPSRSPSQGTTPTTSPPILSLGGRAADVPTLKRSFELFTSAGGIPQTPPSSFSSFPPIFPAAQQGQHNPQQHPQQQHSQRQERRRVKRQKTEERTTGDFGDVSPYVSASQRDYSLNGLSPELQLRICEYLDIPALCALSLVNSYYHRLADSTPWQRIFDERIGVSPLLHRWRVEATSGRPSSPPLPLRTWKEEVVEARRVSRKWELGGSQTTLLGHKKPIKNLQFIGNQLMTCDETVIKEWDMNQLKLKESFSNSDQKCLTFRFDDQNLLVSTLDTVRVYEQHSKKLLYVLPEILSPIITLRFNQSRIWTGAWNGSILVWRTRDGAKVLEMPGHNNPIYCMDVQGDIVVTGSSDKWIKVWNSSTGNCLATLRGHTKTVQSLQFERHLVISSSRDSTIRLWDIRMQNSLVGTLMGHNGDVTCVRFDATRIVSGSIDKTIKVWDLRTQRWMYNLVGHTGGVTCLEFSNSMIVSGAEDTELKVWRFDV